MNTNVFTIRPIAHVQSDYNEKFGIPRQSGLVPELTSRVVIDPAFRNVDAVRGLTAYSHIWLIWGFSETAIDMTEEPVRWSPTVRPPRLGGTVRKGVWATRSPYRPNSLGLSSVRLLGVEIGGRPLEEHAGSGETNEEIALLVAGADLMNGTPVYDIKPYIYPDCHPEANTGFAAARDAGKVHVDFPEDLLARIPEDKRAGLIRMLELDPRGAYEKQPGYNYGLSFAEFDIKFTVKGDVLMVTDVVRTGTSAD
ncbi:MAG: tRNA (N6-threonylcarbamoyladenosine(37)-N6)-methyltransferase TrmO [Mogibacterium sp.]|nr:tRNA (N6-threonylcarbamoyladenosine(37)-N6)-methyltransferase TrmO [Mogibacterium sp.]